MKLVLIQVMILCFVVSFALKVGVDCVGYLIDAVIMFAFSLVWFRALLLWFPYVLCDCYIGEVGVLVFFF